MPLDLRAQGRGESPPGSISARTDLFGYTAHLPGDGTDIVVEGARFAEDYCNSLSGGPGFDPALGARNDCDQDGVPDVVELTLGAPGDVSPVEEDRVRTALCFATGLRTRLPLPDGTRLHCNDGGNVLLSSATVSAEWRIVLDDTRYRGMDYTLGAATADNAPGRSAGGLLPARYWLADPEFTGLVQLMLLPRVELDVPARVPVYTRYEYVDGGDVLDPRLVDEPPARQGFTHRGESYRGPGRARTIYYAVTDDSLDPDRARSVPQRAGLRLFGSTAAVDALSYRVELLTATATEPLRLSGQVRLRSGAIGASPARVTDLPLLTLSDLAFARGMQRLRVVLRARGDDLVLEQSLDANVRGMLRPDDDLRARTLWLTGAAAPAFNPFPLGYPMRFDVALSDSFYENANTPRHSPVAHFGRPELTGSTSVFTLNVLGLHSVLFQGLRVVVHVLNYATGDVAELTRFGGISGYANAPGDQDNPTMSDIYQPVHIGANQLCGALGGCDFAVDPFYLFELRMTLVVDGENPVASIVTETEVELPPGSYEHTHNRDGTGTTITGTVITEDNRPRVVVARAPMNAGRADVFARITQMVQFGGPVPGSTTTRSYADADYDGVPDSGVTPADLTRLDFAVGRATRSAASLYGSIRTPLRFARVHLGNYGRAAYLRAPDVGALPRLGANIGRLDDRARNAPDYPLRGGDPLGDFAIDFSISCDSRLARGTENSFDGTPVSMSGIRSTSVATDCLGELTPVLLSFPAGSITRGVLPAQVVALRDDSRTGFNRAPTHLCGFIPGGVLLSEAVRARRTERGCPPVSVSNGRTADTGDSFAFAGLNAEGVCPDLRDQSQWSRINRAARGGERCLRLLVSDNGPNDAVRFENVIADPLVWSDDADFTLPVSPGPSERGGGGIVDPWFLLALLLVAMYLARIQRKRIR